VLLVDCLDERAQRLYLGSEAWSLGHGGVTVVARAAGLSRQTVAAGAAELEAGQGRSGRVRRSGGGRKRAAELDSGLCRRCWPSSSPTPAVTRPRHCGGPRNRPGSWPLSSPGPVTGSPLTPWPGYCGRRVAACRPTSRPSKAPSIPTVTPSSGISPNGSLIIRPPAITADAGGSNGYRTRAWNWNWPRWRPRPACRSPSATFRQHLEVERDRTPPVLPHHHQLARPTTDQPPNRRDHHRRDHQPHRTPRPRPIRHRHLPDRRPDRQRRPRRTPTDPPRLPPRLDELPPGFRTGGPSRLGRSGEDD
jgi:hypothetical protein